MTTPHTKFIVLITLMLNFPLNSEMIVANEVNQMNDDKHTPIIK